MKKVILFLVVLFALVLVGCGGDNPGGGDDPGTAESDFEKSFNKIKEYVEENVPYIVTENIELIEDEKVKEFVRKI